MGKVRIDVEGEMRLKSGMEGFSDVVMTDGPKVIGGMGEHMSPTDLLAVSIGGCILTMMGMAAKKGNIDMSGSYAEVNKAYAGVQIKEIVVEIYVETSLDEAQKKALEQAAAMCPVHHALKSELVKVVFHWK